MDINVKKYLNGAFDNNRDDDNNDNNNDDY